ncbi:AlpA family transcriptional regulator [Aureimonas sp. AU22]|uniref:helix-turn-helix transcriptional regulator n=1 Tax=Aureimonas sp. AU22 TaxID=1638162 RepID=UPI000785DE73|nr:helix-turn-helix domain-containing protein [Aureimonas sp. AU22]
MMPDPIKAPEMLLSTDEVMTRLSVGRTTLWEMEKRNELPAAIRLSKRCKRWRASEIEAFIASKGA